MKVLILHQHFKVPHYGGAIRSWYLASALVQRGINVSVVTAHNAPGYHSERIDGIDVHYLPVRYDNRFGFGKRIFAFFSFVARAVRFSRRHMDADVCYAISTPLTTGIAAMWLRRKYGMPYVFEVGDLWPDAPVEMGFVRNVLLRRLLYKMEFAIYRNAQSIVALSHPIRDVIQTKISGKKIYVLPNMADTDFYRPEDKRQPEEEKFGVRGKFVVSYIGALGVANGLDYVLEAAIACDGQELPVHFLICGDGAMLPVLKKSAVNLSLSNVTFIPFRNREGVNEIMNVTDATFICYQPFPILETGSPNKYFDGLAAGKLIIVNFSGWIREEVLKEGCGIYTDPRQAQDFTRKLRPFLEDSDLLKKHQLRARALAEKKYSRRMLGDRFFELVRQEILGADTPW